MANMHSRTIIDRFGVPPMLPLKITLKYITETIYYIITFKIRYTPLIVNYINDIS